MLSTLALAATLLAGACTEDAAPTTGASSRLAPDEPAARHRGHRDRGDRPAPADRAELEARREAHHQAMLDRFDADHDGALSADERAAAHLARVTELIAKLDTDGDGALSATEFAARPGPGRHRGPDFATIDADHDGAISAAELAAVRPPGPPPGGPPGGPPDGDDDRPPPPDEAAPE
ncbi:MAG: EF-hand domain-containing protein [Myxococcales bacterium]|nr:EF-hand domain-containing protein [Myxococcales bacterium]